MTRAVPGRSMTCEPLPCLKVKRVSGEKRVPSPKFTTTS